jgi:hypothetical protein
MATNSDFARLDSALARLTAASDRVERVVVARSSDELGALAASAQTQTKTLLPGAFNATSVDEINNRVTVHVVSDDAAAVGNVTASFAGQPVDVVLDPSRLQPHALTKDGPLPYGIIEGGLFAQTDIRIGNQIGATGCTTGFQAVSPVYGDFTFIAAHCTDLGLPSYQGGWYENGLFLMGTTAGKVFSGNLDVAIISTSNHRASWNRIFLNSSRWDVPVTATIRKDGDVIGQVVCHAGRGMTGPTGYANNAYRCGKIRGRNVSVDYLPHSFGLRESTMCSVGGDSGGVVFAGGTTAIAHGILSGGTGLPPRGTSAADNFCFALYSHLPYALAKWGLHPASPN